MTHHTTTPIDPHRPWIRDERDDPSRMNWVQTLFNPFGMTGKLHFSRAWTFMFMGRLLLFIVPVFGVSIATMAGADLSSALSNRSNRSGCRCQRFWCPSSFSRLSLSSHPGWLMYVVSRKRTGRL